MTRAELHEEEHDAARNIAKFNPLAGLDRSRCLGLSECFRRARQPAACARLSEHRLRTVHARDPSRRR